MKSPSLLKFTALAAGILALIGFAASAQAQNITWSNAGTTNFNLGTNWTGGTAPGAGNRAVFGATATVQPQLTANLTIQGLTFGNAPTPFWTLSSNSTANQLTLTSTGNGTASAISYGTTSTTISANLVLGGALNSTQQITFGGSSITQTISGVISDAGNNVGLQINYGNSNNVFFSALNTYTGNTTFVSNQNGNIRALTTIGNQNAAGAFGAGTTLHFNSGVGNAVFQYNAVNGGEESNKIFAMGGTTGGLEIVANQTGNATALILNSNLAITGSGNKTFTLSGGPVGGLAILNRFDGVIADGSGATAGSVISLLKAGANANWTLTANNTFTGNVAITGGTLNVAKFGNQASTTSNLGAGTTVSMGLTTTGVLLNYTGVGETSNRIINLAGGSGGATINNNGNGTLALTSNLTATGVGSKTLTLGGTNNGEITGNIINNGTNGTTLSSLNFASGSATVTLTSVDGVSVGATISGTGLAGGTTITAINTATKIVTLSSNATGAGLAGSTYTVAGVQNITSLTKSGGGTWTLTGAKSYTGATTLTAGTLEVNNKSSLGNGTGLVIMSGGALQASGNVTGANRLTNDVQLSVSSLITGNNSLEIGGTLFQNVSAGRTLTNNLDSASMLTLNNIDINRDTTANQTLFFSGTGTTTIAGVIANGNNSRDNNLRIDGGTVIITGTNQTYTGNTTIASGGRLQISSISNLGSGPLQFANTTNGTAALALRSDGNATFAKNASGVGSVAIDNIAEFNVDRLTNSGPSNGTITWGILGNTLLMNNDRGQFLVTGANGYGLTMNQNLSWPAVNQTDKANIVNNAPGLLTLQGNLIAPSTNNRSFEISGTGDILVNGTITGGGYFLNKTGTNTLTLANTVTTPTTGCVTISGGTVRLNGNGTLATSAPLTVNAGTMDLNGINTTITTLGLGNGLAGTTANVTTGAGTLTLGGTVTYNSPSNANGATISGNINLGNAIRAFVVNDSSAADNDLTISAGISGGGASGAITKSGAGTLALTSDNTAALSGNTIIQAGMIAVGNNNAFGTGQVRFNTTGNSTVAGIQSTDGTARTINNVLGAFTGTTPVLTFGAATGAGTGSLSFTNTTAVALGATRDFTVNNTTTFANAFTGNGTGITKNGAGTLILTGNNTYTGATNVSAGTLIVNGTYSGNGSTTVSFGATLGGSGTLAGATTVDGIFAPGNSIGQFNITNNVTWNGTAANAWKFELGAANSADLLNITGNFLKGSGGMGDFVFDFANTGQVGTFKLVDWTGTTGFDVTDFTYTNLGGSNLGTFAVNGSQLELVVVPEPSTLVMFTGALLALILFRRRSRRLNA